MKNCSKICYCGSCNCNMFEKLIDACATIHVDGDKGPSISSGCFINKNRSQGLFLTTYHSVEDIINDTNKCLYITNPKTKQWCKIKGDKIFYDGIADVAIIKTDINLSSCPQYTLSLACKEPTYGDDCYLIGNPLGYDTKSVSKGVVRDPHFCDTRGSPIIDILLIDTPGFSGNSGSPILDCNGCIIGLYTYGYNQDVNDPDNPDDIIGEVGSETLSGGTNLCTLKKSLSVLCTGVDNKEKKFIGLCYVIADPFTLSKIYDDNKFDNKGLCVNKIHSDSPLFTTLCEKNEIDVNNDTLIDTNDSNCDTNNLGSGWYNIEIILLSATIKNNNKKINFGILPNQRPLGVLCYEYDADEVCFTYYSKTYGDEMDITVKLNKTYEDVDEELDYYSNVCYEE